MRKFLLLVVCVFVSGCTNSEVVQKQYDNDKPSTILIDAKQRAINVYGKGEKVCTEQAPDALSALATSLAANIDTLKFGANLSLAQGENTGSLSFRTQLTQAQSQLLYELCALQANRSISEDELAIQLRHFQNSLAALLAIEQLTGVVKPTSVAVGVGATASVADQLAAAQKQLDQAMSDAKSLSDAIATDTDEADKKIKMQKLADTQANIKAYTANRDALRGGLTTGVVPTQVVYNNPTSPAPLSDNVASSLNDAVSQIVKISADNGYTDTCLVLLLKNPVDDRADKLDCYNHMGRVDVYLSEYMRNYFQLKKIEAMNCSLDLSKVDPKDLNTIKKYCSNTTITPQPQIIPVQ